MRPAKAAHLRLDPRIPSTDAIKLIIRSCLDHFLANTDGVLGSNDSEFIHQARVALRRMRSAIRYAPCDDPFLTGLKPELKWLAGRLGAARDWDVLLEETLPGVLKIYPDTQEAERILISVRRRRAAARRQVRGAVSSARCSAMLDSLEHWLDQEEWAAPALSGRTLTKLAAKIISKHNKRLLRIARHLPGQIPQRRHRARIIAKRLRYAMQHFGSLFGHASVKAVLNDVSIVQDELGALNDAATAGSLLADLESAEPLAYFVRELLAAREESYLSRAQEAIERLKEHKPFWKHPAWSSQSRAA